MKRSNTHIRIAIWLSLSLCFTIPLVAQSFQLNELSEFRIEGTSSINSFTCVAKNITGFGALRTSQQKTAAETPIRRVSNTISGPAAQVKTTSADSAKIQITVGVRQFDCNIPGMNKDLYMALKADRFPEITFTLEEAHLVSPLISPENPAWIRAFGRLSLAGADRYLSIELQGYRFGANGIRGYGHIDLRMTDFNVTPPTALLGLVQAHDEITIRFDLNATLNSK